MRTRILACSSLILQLGTRPASGKSDVEPRAQRQRCCVGNDFAVFVAHYAITTGQHLPGIQMSQVLLQTCQFSVCALQEALHAFVEPAGEIRQAHFAPLHFGGGGYQMLLCAGQPPFLLLRNVAP